MASPPEKRKRISAVEDAQAATYYQQLDPEQVQIRSNKAEVERRIAALVQRKRAEIDQSNQLEFTSFAKQGAAAQDMTSARTDPADLNRTIQMRLDVVDNGDGPLSRLVAAPSRAGSGRHIKCDGVEERLSNIEQHLNVQYATPIPLDIYERLKVLEEKIMRLERDHPTWAAIHFQQPGRTYPPPPTPTIVKKNAKGDITVIDGGPTVCLCSPPQ